LCGKAQVIDKVSISSVWGLNDHGYNELSGERDRDKRKSCFEYLLKDSIITSVSVGGRGDCPIETLTFFFRNIQWKFSGFDGGVTVAEWDIKTHGG
jgi:type VI protein secretion system component Hcp